MKPEEIKNYISEYRARYLSLLKQLVEIHSDSNNFKGCSQVSSLIRSELEDLGLKVLEVTDAQHPYLLAGNIDRDDHGYLFLGHMDTVFPEEFGFNHLKIEEGIANGPGVCDMKGGIVCMLLGLRVLKELDVLDEIPVRIILNSDEEIGSNSVRGLFQQVKPVCLGVFNFEPARASGALVIERKGVGVFRLIASGKSAHAGCDFRQGCNAILELSHKITLLSKLTDLNRGLTVNPGIISGGFKSNIVPDKAEVEIDVRFVQPEDREHITGYFRKILSKSHVAGCSVSIEGDFSRPPFPRKPVIDRTLKYFDQSSKELYSFGLSGESTGGAADINFFGDMNNIYMIDGLGPVGGKDHTREEYIELESLFERAAIFCNAIISIDKDRRAE